MFAGRFREYCFGFEYLFSKILPPPTAPRRKGRRDSAPVSRQKKNTNTESVVGGRAEKKDCLFVGKLRKRKWSLCKNTHYMTHTAPWSILWGQGVAIRARLFSFQV